MNRPLSSRQEKNKRGKPPGGVNRQVARFRFVAVFRFLIITSVLRTVRPFAIMRKNYRGVESMEGFRLEPFWFTLLHNNEPLAGDGACLFFWPENCLHPSGKRYLCGEQL